MNYFFGTGATSVVVADFTNNGKLDALVGGQAGAAFFLGNGDGTFQGANYILTTQSVVGPAADFNRDGNEDLIINYGVYLGNGKGGFEQAGGVTGRGDAVADLNGDGSLDVVNFYAPRALYYEVLSSLGNGNGTFQSPITIESADLVLGVPQAGDFNGDGRPDIAIAWATVADYDEGTLQGIQILLNTTPSAPGVTVSPSALTFPSQPVGTSSSPPSVTVNNTGKGVLTVSSVKLTGASASEFSQTNNCTSIQPGANCIIKVVFTPSAGGNAAASLAITDNAVGSPQAVALSGTSTAASVTVSPTAVTFPSQAVGATSSPANVTLNNISSNAVLTVSGVAVSGTNADEFNQSNNCTTVQPKASCTIKVVFAPTAVGNAAANLEICEQCRGRSANRSVVRHGHVDAGFFDRSRLGILEFCNHRCGTNGIVRSCGYARWIIQWNGESDLRGHALSHARASLHRASVGQCDSGDGGSHHGENIHDRGGNCGIDFAVQPTFGDDADYGNDCFVRIRLVVCRLPAADCPSGNSYGWYAVPGHDGMWRQFIAWNKHTGHACRNLYGYRHRQVRQPKPEHCPRCDRAVAETDLAGE